MLFHHGLIGDPSLGVEFEGEVVPERKTVSNRFFMKLLLCRASKNICKPFRDERLKVPSNKNSKDDNKNRKERENRGKSSF